MVTLIIITAICFGLIIAGGSIGEEDLAAAGFIFLIMTAIFGWGLFGGLHTTKSTTTNEVVRVLHDKSSVHLSYNGNIIKTYNDVATYTHLSDKEEVTVIQKKNLNMYGGLIAITWELPAVTQ